MAEAWAQDIQKRMAGKAKAPGVDEALRRPSGIVRRARGGGRGRVVN